MTIYSIGHSTRPIDAFLALLKSRQIELLADVRTIPKSRHNPQFNEAALRQSLHAAGIEYLHMKGLGGLRHASAASINTAWRNASFRGYADYMQTPEFAENLDRLIEFARTKRTAVMCAEAVPWRCHRSLIADALLVRGIETADIQSPTRAQPHKLTPFAKVAGTRITYPKEASE